jgi:NhaA family Na+:H+ antiporter
MSGREVDEAGTTPEGKEFSAVEATAGAVLIVAAIVAVVWANSPWRASYHDLWQHQLPDRWLGLNWPSTPAAWIADMLMAVYFFVAGLEIKRELVSGELRDPKRAVLPVAAAVGGMLVPATIYAALNTAGPGANGWGVPMATDIAFALGVLAVIGRGLPSQVRVFLLTLAIVDDIGSIAVIAIFYTSSLRPIWFLIGVAFVVVIQVGFRVKGTQLTLVAIGAIGLWISLFQAGIHPTIAGVICGLMAPAVEDARGDSTAEGLVHRFHPWSSFVIAPLFALSAAGITLTAAALRDALSDHVAIGVFLGLVVGKPVGILLGAVLVLRAGWATRPPQLSWASLAGLGALAGIGFTISILISQLAFADVATRNAAELAILAAALAAVVVSTPILTMARRRTRASDSPVRQA